ncbi:Leucine rich repeat-containing protein [Flavobacterium sp. CF108]|uniref:leucine-rich repeat protein n=1 Tax=unclassified Flavobacterium TaxID=196869 RepID=UPI0008B48495|nr:MULTISPECIES: leucine-rich repeat protein [unclassified Flavobacterium]SEO96059.1 Leucine rich repeat-containing protein [Flavobacterium sp. fv08]SHH81730.1 Leucine rich repeat-containing protein [Flavobacterium sp. CF108]
MGSLIQNTIFGKSNYKINTYIGGIGDIITTPALLAAKLGISANRIKMFRISDNNIECAIIGGTYIIPSGAFHSNSKITSYNDKEGLVSTINSQAFRFTSNLTEVNFPNVTTIKEYSFQESKISADINFPNCTTVETNSFTFLKGTGVLNFPSLTNIAINSFISPNGIYTINVPLSLMTINNGKPHSELTDSRLGKTTINYIGYVPDNSYNTEIGNVANIVTSRSILANTIGIGSGGIVNFQIIGSNIRFKILDNYVLKLSLFEFKKSITYYDDSIGGFVSDISNDAFNQSTIQWAKFYGITKINGNNIIRDTSTVTSFEMPNLITFNADYFGRNCENLTTLSFPNLTAITSVSAFYADANGIKNFYFPKCRQLGPNVSQNSVFYLCKTGSIITVNAFLQTCNSGLPDGDLQYAISSRGASVNYIS